MAILEIKGYAIVLLLLCCIPGAFVLADIEVIDDAGRTVHLSQTAQRIVSLSPHTTELLFAAGAGQYVVAVSAFSDFPAQAKDLPVISGGSGIDVERILSLEPDLVVAWRSGNAQPQLRQLERLGLAVFYSEPATIDGIATNLESLGALSGTLMHAKKTAANFRLGIRQLKSKYQNAKKLTAFYQIWNPPLMTIGGGHLISQWLALCGVMNIFSDQEALAPVVSKESVLSRNPDIIISGQFGLSRDAFESYWRQWQHLRAVKEGNFILQDSMILSRQVPRALIAATELCSSINTNTTSSSATEYLVDRPEN